MSAGRRAKSRIHHSHASLIGRFCLSLALLSGCEHSDSERDQSAAFPQLPALQALHVKDGSAVVARGQLQPAQGMIVINGPVGDRLVRLDVAEGQTVEQGATLGVLESLQMRQAELAVAHAQLAEAKARFEAEENVAHAKLDLVRVGLRQAELALSQAEMEFESAKAPDGRIALLQQQVRLATNSLDKLREASKDPTAGQLVTNETLDRQQLQVSQYQAELQAAQTLAEQKIESAKLAVEAAQREIEAAELTIASIRASASRDSQQLQAELLELRIQATRLVSPLTATVVSIETVPGETTMGRPIMHLADTSKMVCRTEINVADLPRIEVGAVAKLSGPALRRPLSGTVEKISQVIGSPSLASADPLARVDWRSADVVIAIDAQDSARASRFINLQVDVAIEAKTPDAAATASVPLDSDE